jgi:Tol biopolymer transport system component
MDRDGKSLGTVGEPERYQGLGLSRDDRKIAVAYPTGAPENVDIFVLDAVRGSPTRLTFDAGVDTVPVWAPDGSRIAFQGNRRDERTLRQKLVNGTAEDETVLADPAVVFTPTDWSLDGRFLAFNRAGGGSRFADVWVVPMTGDRKPFPVVETAGNDANASFSPDGRWLAYESTDASQAQVFVQPFPPTGGKYQISRTGGFSPMWSADGKELFFLARDGTLMAVAVDPSRQFGATPQRLFSTGVTGSIGRSYVVAKDAKRFLVNVPETRATPTLLTVVINWLGTIQK